MTFTAPVAEQRFLLRHIAGVHDLIGVDRFAYLDEEIVEASFKAAPNLLRGSSRRCCG
jgi:hypothetical protein